LRLRVLTVRAVGQRRAPILEQQDVIAGVNEIGGLLVLVPRARTVIVLGPSARRAGRCPTPPLRAQCRRRRRSACMERLCSPARPCHSPPATPSRVVTQCRSARQAPESASPCSDPSSGSISQTRCARHSQLSMGLPERSVGNGVQGRLERLDVAVARIRGARHCVDVRALGRERLAFENRHRVAVDLGVARST